MKQKRIKKKEESMAAKGFTQADWEDFWYNSPEIIAQKEDKPNEPSKDSQGS